MNTPKTTIQQRFDQDPGTPMAHSTPDPEPKPRIVRGFRIRKLILPGEEKTEVDPDIRPSLNIFNVRCARQCNDLLVLHNMQKYYIEQYECLSLCDCEFNFIESLLKVISERLIDELHCRCVECSDWRELRVIEEMELAEFEREHF